MDLSTSVPDLITATYTAFLAVVGWLIISQINTNKQLSKTITEAIIELRAAVSLFEAREKSQQQVCEFHRKQTDEIRKHMEGEIRKIRSEITIIKTQHNEKSN